MPTADDIDQQQRLLATHRRTLADYLRQRAIHGEAYTPPAVGHGIREVCAAIRQIKATLRGWGETVEDHPDDQADQRLTDPGSRVPTCSPQHMTDWDATSYEISDGFRESASAGERWIERGRAEAAEGAEEAVMFVVRVDQTSQVAGRKCLEWAAMRYQDSSVELMWKLYATTTG